MAKCSEKRKDGEQCTAPAVREGKCAGHAGLGIAANPKEGQRLSSEARRRKAKQRSMTLTDLLAERLEAKAAEIADAYEEAVDQRDMRSIEAWITRVYGKPVERAAVDTTGEVGAMAPGERARLRARAVARLTLVEPEPDVATTDTTGEGTAA